MLVYANADVNRNISTTLLPTPTQQRRKLIRHAGATLVGLPPSVSTTSGPIHHHCRGTWTTARSADFMSSWEPLFWRLEDDDEGEGASRPPSRFDAENKNSPSCGGCGKAQAAEQARRLLLLSEAAARLVIQQSQVEELSFTICLFAWNINRLLLSTRQRVISGTFWHFFRRMWCCCAKRSRSVVASALRCCRGLFVRQDVMLLFPLRDPPAAGDGAWLRGGRRQSGSLSSTASPRSDDDWHHQQWRRIGATFLLAMCCNHLIAVLRKMFVSRMARSTAWPVAWSPPTDVGHML